MPIIYCPQEVKKSERRNVKSQVGAANQRYNGYTEKLNTHREDGRATLRAESTYG